MSLAEPCARCHSAAVSKQQKFCPTCKAAIVAEAQKLVARWPTAEGHCRLCGWHFAASGHGTHSGRMLYCSEDHFQVFGMARMLAQGTSYHLWLDEQYQAWVNAPHEDVPAPVVLPPPPIIITPYSVQRDERRQAALADGAKTCEGWHGIHEPVRLPLVFFTKPGDTFCKVCGQARAKHYRETHQDEEMARRRAQYQLHREASIERAQAYYEATYMEKRAQRQAQLAQVVAAKQEQHQQQITCAHGVCATPGQCGRQCAALMAHMQKIGVAIQGGLHTLAAQGFHPSNQIAVGYRGVEVPQAFRPSGIKRQGNKPRYGIRLVKDEEIADRVQLAWDLRLNGASYKEIHQRCQLYEVLPKSGGGYVGMFRNPLYAGILRWGGIWYPLNWEQGARCCEAYVTLDDWETLARRRGTSNPLRYG